MASTMKDSGVEWIGKVPEQWSICKLKYLLKKPMQYGANEKGVSYSEKLPRYVRITDITSDNKLKDTGKLSLSEDVAKEFILEDGDILFARSGATVGKSFIYQKENGFCAFAGYLIRAITNEKIIPKYIYYYTLSSAYESWKNRVFIQATIQNIGADKYSNMQISVPSTIEEQEKIIAFLDDKIGEVDTIISKTKASIEEYKKYKNAIITETVTKGLDKTVKMKESGIEWVGEIPAHWEIHTLSQVFMQLKNKNSNLSETNLLSLSYGKIKRKDINSTVGLLPESFEGYNIIDKNDIVLRLTDLQNDHKSLRVGHVKERGIITSAYVTLRCKEDMATDYYYYFLHTFDIFKGFYGMGAGVRQGLNYEGIRSMKILSPDKKEQKEIVEYLNVKCVEIDALIAKKEAFVEEMEAYKKSIIYEYVTGKKEVI